MTKILYGNFEKSFLECEINGFKKHLPALFQLFEKLTRANLFQLELETV